MGLEKKSIAFLFENSYQQFYSEILSSYFLKRGCHVQLIFYGRKSSLFFKLKGSIDIIEIPKNNKGGLMGFQSEKKRVMELGDRLLKKRTSVLFIFKDHSFFNAKLIKILHPKIKSILIEEGLSLYSVKGSDSFKLRIEKRLLKYYLRQVLYWFFGGNLVKEEFACNKLLYSTYAFEPSLIPEVKKVKNVKILPSLIPLKTLNFSDKFNDINFDKSFLNGVLILISPFLFLKRRKEEVHLSKIQKMIDTVNESGLKCVLKTHPLESKQLYSSLEGTFMFIDNDDLPIETLYHIVKPIAVISEGSSASVNYSRFFGVKSFIFLSDFIQTTTLFKDVSGALEVIKKYCICINSTNEIKEELLGLEENTNQKIIEEDNISIEYDNLIDDIIQKI